MSFKVELIPSKVVFDTEHSFLDDAIKQSIYLEHSCKTGDCGVCTAELIQGEVTNENGDSVTQGEILLCQSKAKSDVILKANYYPELSSIQQVLLPCKVSSTSMLTQDIIQLILRLPPTSNFEYLAGQYINLSFNGVKRSYSIANVKSENNEIELHVRKVKNGKMSELLFNGVKRNQLMRIEGPKGTFFLRDNNRPIIFLATGTGIAPVKAMVEELVQKNDPRRVYIYWGMRYAHEIYCKELREIVTKSVNINFKAILSKELSKEYSKGYVQDVVCDDFESLGDYQVYACGSLNMINSAKSILLNKGLKEANFISDAFTAAK